MRYLKGKGEELAKRWFDYSIGLAKRSNCSHAQHGAIIIRGADIVGEGCNTPVPDRPCEPCTRKVVKGIALEELCRSVHAEENAIMDAYLRSNDIVGAVMFHAKLKGGAAVFSDGPSCTKCSRLVLKAGLSGFVLRQEDGFCLYTAEEFNKLSYENVRRHFEDVLKDF